MASIRNFLCHPLFNRFLVKHNFLHLSQHRCWFFWEKFIEFFYRLWSYCIFLYWFRGQHWFLWNILNLNLLCNLFQDRHQFLWRNVGLDLLSHFLWNQEWLFWSSVSHLLLCNYSYKLKTRGNNSDEPPFVVVLLGEQNFLSHLGREAMSGEHKGVTSVSIPSTSHLSIPSTFLVSISCVSPKSSCFSLISSFLFSTSS